MQKNSKQTKDVAATTEQMWNHNSIIFIYIKMMLLWFHIYSEAVIIVMILKTFSKVSYESNAFVISGFPQGLKK